MTPQLERFKNAQEDSYSGFAAALAELRAGRKRSHWIWYVFPQLAGLGSSAAAQTYGIADEREAEAYLREPTLRGRLLAAATAALEQHQAGVPLASLMGARIDVLKLVSSMTLFGAVARRLSAADDTSDLAQFADVADAILDAATTEGFPPCAYTRHALGRT